MSKTSYRSEQSYQILMNLYNQQLAQFPLPYESCLIPTRYGATHILVTGTPEKPPLLLFHGALSNAVAWQPNVADLSQHFRLYLVDLPGDAGKSAPNAIPRSGREHADWLLDVLDGLGIEKAYFGGLSLGGWIALLMAKYEPARVKRLVLIAPVMFLPISVRYIVNALWAGLRPTPQSIAGFLRFMTAPTTPLDNELAHGMYLMAKHIQSSPSIPAAFTDADLQRINLPVLFIVGEYEVLYNPHKAIERAHKLLPNVQTKLIANAGHITPWEQPQVVNQAIIDFLSQ